MDNRSSAVSYPQAAPVHPADLRILPILKPMNSLENFVRVMRDSVSILEQVRGMTLSELQADDLNTGTAETIHKLSNIYFGPTDFPEEQSECATAARANELPFYLLNEFEVLISRIDDESEAWQMRRRLCRHPDDFDDLRLGVPALLDSFGEFNGPEIFINRSSEVTESLKSIYARPRSAPPEA